MFSPFWGEQQAVVAIVAAACYFNAIASLAADSACNFAKAPALQPCHAPFFGGNGGLLP
jgi:hypothetical protein